MDLREGKVERRGQIEYRGAVIVWGLVGYGEGRGYPTHHEMGLATRNFWVSNCIFWRILGAILSATLLYSTG